MAHGSVRRAWSTCTALAVILLVAGGCTSPGSAASTATPATTAAAAPTTAAAAASVVAPATTPSAEPATPAAVSTTTPASTPTSPAAAPSTAPSASSGGYSDGYGYGGYGGSSASAGPSVPPPAARVGLGTAQITGVGTVLVGPDGRTLYTFKPDAAGVSTCDGGCAQAWPPFAATTLPSLPAGAAGTVTLITRTDGTRQVAYNGRPLYSYAGDSAPGDAAGQGKGGAWFVATP
jgi:predicted lipoprotein with Yx(FWY)xxD motif